MPRNHHSEIRKDYFLDRYVIITPRRARRPRDIKEQTTVEARKPCPFDPENIEKELEIETVGPKNKWYVKVLKNKYPALTPDNPKAYGFQEVIIETSRHHVEIGELPIEHIIKVIEVYARRTTFLSKQKNIEYILIFKNYGGKAGASIFHSHSQVFASQLLPPEVMEELQKAHAYRTKNGSCPYCDIIKKEKRGPRNIMTDRNVVAFAPYASQFHHEAWIIPCRHIDNITQLTSEEKKSFACAMKLIISKLNSLELSYNFFLHQVIKDSDQHFYLKIQPREAIWAGVELGSGVVINSVPPEQAARFYREQEKKVSCQK